MNRVNSRLARMSKLLFSITLVFLVCLCACASRALAVEDPQAVIKAGMDEVTRLLKEYPQDTSIRREKIREVVDGYVDFDAVARLAVGPQWRNLPPGEQQVFTKQFKTLLFNTYMKDIDKYAERKITYRKRAIDRGYVAVEMLMEDQGGSVSLDYYLHLRDGKWKVYDIAVAGRSLAANYRDRFDRVLANGSFDDLSKLLSRKIAEICESTTC